MGNLAVMSRDPIKLMYIMDYYDNPRGGTESQLFKLLNNLDRERFEPYLVFFRYTDYLLSNSFSCPIKVVKINKMVSLDTLIKGYHLSYLIRQWKIDIVHTFFNDASVIAPFFCKIGGAKVIVSRRDMGFWYTPLNLAALKVSNLFVDRIVTNSKAVKENVRKREGFPEKKIVVIYNGHNGDLIKIPSSPNFRKSYSIGTHDPIIGMAAHLYPMKRQSDLIRAFTVVRGKYPNAHLVFAGEGKDAARLKELAKSLHIEQQVHFIGSVSDIISIVRHFDVCVLCSESEGLSNAVIEYMGCGKPVICTNVGGNPEIIEDGHNGFLVEVGDVSSIAERILRILANDTLSQMLGRNAQLTVEKKFRIREMIDSHMSLYNQVIYRG